MTDELVLSLRGVSAGYREGGILGRKRFHEVIHDVSFDVHRGEILGLVGECIYQWWRKLFGTGFYFGGV